MRKNGCRFVHFLFRHKKQTNTADITWMARQELDPNSFPCRDGSKFWYGSDLFVLPLFLDPQKKTNKCSRHHSVSVGPTSTHLGSVTLFGYLGPTWTHIGLLETLGLNWIHLESLGLTRTYSDPLGLSWTPLDHIVPPGRRADNQAT